MISESIKEEVAELKSLIYTIRKMSLRTKIILVMMIVLISSATVFAWLAYQDKIEALSKIKEPPSINLASGGDDSALYISLENIDVSVAVEKYVVFSIEPGKYSAYDIQLSHTTNIPFTYELYRVREDENGTIEYTDHTRDVNGGETILKYSIMANATGTTAGKLILNDINPDDGSTGRILGDEGELSASRKNYVATDEVNQYVKPIYSVVRRVPQFNEHTDGSSDRDYFVIKLTWTPGNSNMTYADANYWNYAFNNKETDIIYISAKQNTYEEP
ncbi:MAG: hypothetical protein K6G88_15360 [Lachnospiraceae bacterium]|nr:hypothetical protein [Lachnospiraceae bacterium]